MNEWYVYVLVWVLSAFTAYPAVKWSTIEDRFKNDNWTQGDRFILLLLCLMSAPLALLVGSVFSIGKLLGKVFNSKFWDQKASW